MGSNRILRPVKIEAIGGGAVRIDWADGRMTQHNYRELRLACQCAMCRDEMTGERKLRPEQVPEDIHPTSIEPVGSYALRFIWSDGHSTGMFPFQFLYDQADAEENPQ